MKLTKDQVQHVAKLARIELTEADVEKFQRELSAILDYVEKLNEIDTQTVEPTAQVTGFLNVTREDRVISREDPESLANPTDLIQCSPLPIERNQIKVKSVF